MKLYVIKATDGEIYWNELIGWVLDIAKATVYGEKDRKLLRKLKLSAGTTKIYWAVREWDNGW